MNGITNIASPQQTQTSQPSTSEVSGATSNVTKQSSTVEVQTSQSLQGANEENTKSINSPKEVEDLVTELNDALSPMSTSLKFGVDKDDIFYVSVIDVESNEMIKRFPAEKAAEFLPKMQEVTGMLFDSKG